MNKEQIIEKLDKWLDTLNYWDSAVAECAERGGGMNWYKRYEKAQDEMYNLYKELKGDKK